MDEIIDSLGDVKIFSTLEAGSGYWQIGVQKSDRESIAIPITSYYGLYQFTIIYFGLWHAMATFQHVIDVILRTVNWHHAIVYLEEIFIFTKTIERHIFHRKMFLRLLKLAGVALKLKKCDFFTNKIGYLGHVIRPGRCEVASYIAK